MSQSTAGRAFADLLIVGGGIMGLWAAVHAERMGIDTLLVDAGALGRGASGGLLGALMPHMPDRWSAKKQFQFDALVSLEAEIAAVEAQTGLGAGYRRCGRLIPLPKPHLRAIALRHSEDAALHWQAGAQHFAWNVLDAPPVMGWVDPDAGESGFVHDTLAARVAPRSLLAALQAFLRDARHVRIAEGLDVRHIDPLRRQATAEGGDISFGCCILAGGHRSFAMLEALTPGLQAPLGQAVKGQAALLRGAAAAARDLPVVFLDGLYVVAHEDGLVAVGSTSENSFADPAATDSRLDDVLAAARSLVPALAAAEVVERWAGLRPKAIDRDPMVGRHPEHPALVALTGGFKVSFGLAHRLALAAVEEACARPSSIALPASFRFAHHIGVASRKR